MKSSALWTSQPERHGYSLLELVVSLAAAVVLMAGMASAVAVSTRTLALSDTGSNVRATSAEVHRDLLADLQRATGFTERTANAVTFTVPDRTGDGQPDTLRYAWSGTPGAPLTLQMNGGAVQNIAEDVRDFSLLYRTQTLTAPAVPDQTPPSSGRLLFVSGPPGSAPTFGQQVGGSPGSPVMEISRDPKISLFQSWGFDVTSITADQSQASFDAALANSDVIYLASDNGLSQAASKVANSTLGIVNENVALAEPLGFYQGTGSASGTSTVIGLTGHYITQGYSARQRVTLTNASTSLQTFLNPKATGISILGVETATDKIHFATLTAGRKRFDGTTANGRRVQLPWATTDFSTSTLTSDGKALLKSSLLWAAGNGSSGNSSYTNFGATNSNRVNYFSSAGTHIHTSRWTLYSRGELMELTAYVRSNNLPLRMAVYTDNAGVPQTLLTQTGVLTGTSSEGWITGAVNPVILEPGFYWMAIFLSDSSQRAYYDDPFLGTVYQISGMTFANGFPSTWGPGSGGSTNFYWFRQLVVYGSFLALP